MGKWQHTSYIEGAAPKRVADAMVSLFRREGMQQVAEPAPFSVPFDAHRRAIDSAAWAVGVIPGGGGWTIIKTLPLELFGERASNATRMRLIDLAGLLGTAALQVNLYETAFLVLIEVDCQSGCLLSGYGPGSIRNPDPLRFNDEQLAEDRIDVRFELLPFQQLVWESTRYGYAGPTLDNEQLVSRLARKLGGENAAWCDNERCSAILLTCKPLPIEGGITLYFGRPAD
jgi:hypothetical protein